EPPVPCGCDAQRARERLEHRFDLVMARAAVQHLHVHVAPGPEREALKKVVDELRLQIADPRGFHLDIDDGMRPAPEIDGRDGERDRRLVGSPVDYRAAHNTSSITSMQRRVCSTMPAPIRMQPAQPGSVERSRMYTPRAKAPFTRASVRSPVHTRTKFAELRQ